MSLIDRTQERAFTIECLKVYKSLPALWNFKSPEYRNKHRKDESYSILVSKFHEKCPNMNRRDVTKKINTLRTNFRKELKRMERDRRKHSKLWYFDAMKFLCDDLESMKEEEPTQKCMYDDDEPYDLEILHENECSHTVSETPEDSSIVGGKTDPIDMAAEESFCIAGTSNTASSCILGEYERKLAETWAMELQKMSPEQQIYAKKAINDIIYEGQLGNLNRNRAHIY